MKKKEENFGKKAKQMKKIKKKHVGKVKAKFSTSSILKKINKDNFEKKIREKTVAKQKPYEKYCNNPQCFKEKNYEIKFSTSSI